MGYNGDTVDQRLVCYGIRYLVENYLKRQWTMEDLENATKFYRYSPPEVSKHIRQETLDMETAYFSG